MSNTRTTAARKRRPPAAAAPEPKNKPLFLEVFGGKYAVAEQVGIWPLMQFARAAETGTQLTDHRGLAACHAFLEQVVDPADWARFQDDMITKRISDLDALMAAARQAVDALFERRQAEQNGGAPAANGKAVNGSAPAQLTAAPASLRASDSDRDAAAVRLAAAVAAGRITAEEHEERLAAAMAAKTMGDLAAVTSDLPDPAAAPGE